jgi:DNA mismatch repair protein MSH2
MKAGKSKSKATAASGGSGAGQGDPLFAKYFLRTLPQDKRVVRVYDRNGYFTAHGDDALLVARKMYKTTAVVKRWFAGSNEPRLPTVNMNKSMYENVLRAVLLEPGDSSDKSIVNLFEGSGASWTLAKQGSPGKLAQFEEALFHSSSGGANSKESHGLANEASEIPIVMAVLVKVVESQRTVGVAFCNQTTQTIGACQFVDDDHFCALESLTVQIGARECAIIAQDLNSSGSSSHLSPTEARKLGDVFDRCFVMLNERPKQEFGTGSLESDLERLVSSGYVEHCREVLDRKVACGAVAGLLSYMELLADSQNYQKWNVKVHETGQYMRLDAAAMKALNVMRLKGDTDSHFSLSGLMGRGRTPMGKRLVKTWLKQPLLKKEEIEARHCVVEAFTSDIFLRESVRDQYLRGIPDIDRLVKKLERKKISLMEMCMLYRASGRLGLIVDALRGYSGDHTKVLEERYTTPLSECHDETHLIKFEELLESAIDLDRVPEEYLISPHYSEDLLSLYQEKLQTEDEIKSEAQGIADDLRLVLDKSIKLEWHKYSNNRTRCLRITQKEEKTVRKQLQEKYLILETRKDGTKFTNRTFKAAAERLTQITQAYEEKQKELVEAVVNVASSFSQVWMRVSAVLAEMDALLGFADLSLSSARPFVRPKMLADGDGDGRIVLKGARHPLVEATEVERDFMPNDVSLVKGTSWFNIITGPNMGGKSTYIRMVGVVVLMAQVGCFVPCDEAEISVRDAIYARVGAGDCQMRGVSTFMAEMLETASIIKGATSSSLVIIDELGRGTSTHDGFGLAWSISEHIMEEIGAPTLMATHFHELTKVKGTVGVANLHVGATGLEQNKLSMTYQVRPGSCDASFGIAVAEKVNFPPEVIQEAKRYESALNKRIKLSHTNET